MGNEKTLPLFRKSRGVSFGRSSSYRYRKTPSSVIDRGFARQPRKWAISRAERAESMLLLLPVRGFAPTAFIFAASDSIIVKIRGRTEGARTR